MTEAARWNLQHGVPEDKTNEWTDYTPTSELDRWILHHMKMRKMFEEQTEKERQRKLREQQQKKEMKEFEKAAEKQLEKVLEKELEKLLKDFK